MLNTELHNCNRPGHIKPGSNQSSLAYKINDRSRSCMPASINMYMRQKYGQSGKTGIASSCHGVSIGDR